MSFLMAGHSNEPGETDHQMPRYTLSFKPAIRLYGMHDPSAAIFRDGELVFGAEQERFSRNKHAKNDFPSSAIRACLSHCDISLTDVDLVVLPYDPKLGLKNFGYDLKYTLLRDKSRTWKLRRLERLAEESIERKLMPVSTVHSNLAQLGEEVPEIVTRSHHRCHAASAFHPSGFDEAILVTMDGKGEYDATVVWKGNETGLERIRTFEYPNSLGLFFGSVTSFLGYRPFNGEGKVMGLAPYGSENPEIESTLRTVVETGAEYDVTELTWYGGAPRAFVGSVSRLEDLFGRPAKDDPSDFTQWEKDLAYTTQKLTEEIVTDLVAHHIEESGIDSVCLAGGVALNCKMNKRVMEHPAVEELFVQPVAHDGGLAVGGGFVDQDPAEVETMSHVYWGPLHETDTIRDQLEEAKIDYTEPDDIERRVAELLADQQLVGWVQGRLEMGPRALGNRSILADPRTEASRDRVNEYVKHREGWRPFAPSMLESAAEEYLVDAKPSPYMIKTFDVEPDKRDEIKAVLHPGDQTTRPQTVSPAQNERYHRLISSFADITGVPVVLNTSFNDHGEPIVNRPKEAIKDFFAMGLDALALDDFLVRE